MPKRTNEKQEIIALLRRVLATEQCTVTESKLLPCRLTGELREVDVVVEFRTGDIVLNVSFEIQDRGRPADVQWVEQLIKKHESLATNQLVLVSWAGFTKSARRRASMEPTVLAVTPELVLKDGVPEARSLFVDEVALSPKKSAFLVDTGGTSLVRVEVLTDNHVFSPDYTLVGTAHELTACILGQSYVVTRVLRDMHDHPEREDMKWFTICVPLDGGLLALRKDPGGELHPIRVVEVQGEIAWTHQQVDLELRKLGEVVFGHRRTLLGGRPALLVATMADSEKFSRVTTRLYPDDPER